MKSPRPTREHLLSCAVQLIRTLEGPEDFTVRRLTAEAGVNLNAINYYFGSKAGLIREAVRRIIGDYYQANGLHPAEAGTNLWGTVVVICDFLFAEPTASRLALASEQETRGIGPSLTSETMATLLSLATKERPEVGPTGLKIRVWSLVTSIHQFLWQPQASTSWLGLDPRSKDDRDRLLRELLKEVGLA